MGFKISDAYVEVTTKDETKKGLNEAESNFKGFAGKLGGVAAAAGVAVAAAFGAGIMSALETGQTQSLMAAQIGAPPALAKDLGDVAGRAYADGFGESIADASNALKDVWRDALVPEDASNDLLEQTTERVLTLTKLMGEESSKVTAAVSTMLKTGMADSAEEAFDLITRGTQQGIDKQQDLLDTLTEYPTTFRVLGLAGDQSLGLINQALKAGARNSDVAADALKEFSIRAIDGSKTTKEAYKSIGLDAAKMATDIGKGGEVAQAALGLTLDKLREMEDPVARNAAAVGLFGTKAEDMGEALFAMDLDTAVASLGNLEGATQSAADTMGGDALSRMQTYGRSLKVDLTDKLNEAIPKIEEAARSFSEKFGPDIKEATDWLKENAVPVLKDISDNVMDGVRGAIDDISAAIERNRPEIDQLIALWKDAADVMVNDVWPIVGPLLKFAFESLGREISLFIDVVGLLIDAFNLFDSIVRSVFTTATKVILGSLAAITGAAAEVADAMGMDDLANKLRSSQSKINQWVADVNNSLNGIKDQTVVVNFTTTGAGGGTGALKHRAAGGPLDAGDISRVNERGPELLSVAGRQYLMMGDQPGNVISHEDAFRELFDGSGGGGTTIVKVFIDGQEFRGIVRSEIDESERDLGRRLSAGATR